MRTCFLLRYTVSPILLDTISFSLAFLFYVHFLPSVEIKPRKSGKFIDLWTSSETVFGKMSSRLQRLLASSHHSSSNIWCLQ